MHLVGYLKGKQKSGSYLKHSSFFVCVLEFGRGKCIFKCYDTVNLFVLYSFDTKKRCHVLS